MFGKLAAVLVSALFLGVLHAPPGSAAGSEKESAPGEVLVVLRAPLTAAKITSQAVANGDYENYLSSIASSAGGRIAASYGALSQASGSIFALIRSDNVHARDMLDQLKNRPDVIGVSLNRRVRALTDRVTPNEPQFKRLWGMEAIRAPEAWTLHTGTDDTYAVVIDSGIDYTHGDLADNFEDLGLSANFSGGTEADYGDQNGHGTHVAGIIAAAGNNGTGVSGVNWKAKLISLRILDAEGNAYDSEICDALNRLLQILNDNPELKIAAVNMSYGSWPMSATPDEMKSDPEYLAMKALDDTNRVIMCIAAGNDGTEIGNGTYTYPASFTGLKNVIVAASSRNEEGFPLDDNSNYSSRFVDIAAPGTDIWSTVPSDAVLAGETGRSTFTEEGYTYMLMSGTSMATPHLVGAVTFLASAVPNATTAQIKNAILSTANRNYAKGKTANGFLDLKAALDFLKPANEFHGILTQNLPDAIKGSSYTAQLEMRNPEDTVTWSACTGKLPDGLTLSSSGRVSGTPSKSGEFTFTARAEGDGINETREFTITVWDDPVITTEGLPDGKVAFAYEAVLTGKGSEPMTWAVSGGGGKLPDGLTLSADGTITGTPTKAGTYDFTITLTSPKGTDSRDYSIEVTDPVREISMNITYWIDAEFTDGEADYSGAKLTRAELTLRSSAASTETARRASRVKESPEEQFKARRKSKASNIEGTLTIGAGNGSYSYEYYDESAAKYVTETVGTEGKSFGIARDAGSFYVVNPDNGMYITFGEGSDSGWANRHVDWTFENSEGLNGGADIPAVRSVEEQIVSFVPYAKLVSPDASGRYEALIVRMVMSPDVDVPAQAPASGDVDMSIFANFLTSAPDDGDASYESQRLDARYAYDMGGTLNETETIASWGLSWQNIALGEVQSAEFIMNENNSDTGITYRWTFRNPHALGRSDYESEALYLNVNYGSTITMRGGKPDYSSASAPYVNMTLQGLNETPDSADFQALTPGILTIGTGTGSYDYGFSSGDEQIVHTVGTESYDIPLTGNGSSYSYTGTLYGAEGLNGRTVSWIINDNPQLNGSTDILDELLPDDESLPYIEFIMDGDNFTGITWRFKDSSATLKSDAKITVTVLTKQPYEYEAYSGTVRAGEEWSGSCTFDEAVHHRNLTSVDVDVEVWGNDGKIKRTFSFVNDGDENPPKPAGLKPSITVRNNSEMKEDGTVLGILTGNGGMELSLNVSSQDKEGLCTLTIKAGEGTYSYYDYDKGEYVTAGSQDKTFTLYGGGDYDCTLTVLFDDDAFVGLKGRTIEWTTRTFGHESAVFSPVEMVFHGSFASPDEEGRYEAFDWYVSGSSDDTSPIVIDDGSVSISINGRELEGHALLDVPVRLDEVISVYVTVDDTSGTADMDTCYTWTFMNVPDIPETPAVPDSQPPNIPAPSSDPSRTHQDIPDEPVSPDQPSAPPGPVSGDEHYSHIPVTPELYDETVKAVGLSGLSVNPRFAMPRDSSQDVYEAVSTFMDTSTDILPLIWADFLSSRDALVVFNELSFDLISESTPQLAAVILPELRVSEDAVYLFRVPVDNITRADTPLFLHLYGTADDEAFFIDDDGNFVNVLGGAEYINIAVRLSAGTYAPVLAAGAASEDVRLITGCTPEPEPEPTPEPEPAPEPAPAPEPELGLDLTNETLIDTIIQAIGRIIPGLLNMDVEVLALPSEAAGGERRPEDLAAIPSNQTVVLVLPVISVSAPAIYVFGAELDVLPAGSVIFLHLMPEEDTQDAYVFLDDDGNEVTTVPANKHVNIAAYLEPGTYAPVITAENASDAGGGCEAASSSLALLAAVFIMRRKRR